MPKLQRDLFLLLALALVPLVLVAVTSVFGRLHRWRVDRLMKRSAADYDPVLVQESPRERAPLPLHDVVASRVVPLQGAAAAAMAAAADATRRFRQAFLLAALVYVAVVTGTVLSVTMPMPSGGNGLVLALYCLQGPPLWLLLWNIVDSVRLRLLVIAVYVTGGAALVVLARDPPTAAALLAMLADIFVVMPMVGLALLVVRRLRPVLIGLVAILSFIAITIGLAALVSQFGVQLDEIGNARWWAWAIGIANQIVAIPIAGWLIRRGSVRAPFAALAGMFGIGVACASWPRLPAPTLVLLGLPSCVLQVYVVWLLFRLIVRLQDRRYLPPQVLQFHVGFGFLTVYYETILGGGSPFFGGAGRSLPTLAFVLYAIVLHLLLRRQWNSARQRPARRLLFLRTFGGAEKPERLLDWLDDTWRRLGRVDLIAGTDLAMRTLGSRMLEAILLRRADAEFLKTNDDVQGRVGQLRSEAEGDARFPINEVYCYASAWQRAVVMLAPESDAVLMDLSGLTPKNLGCIFELTQLVHLVPMDRVVLITDPRTDRATLEDVLQLAWAHLPAGSPNAGAPAITLTVLKLSGRAAEDAKGLVAMLMRAAHPIPGG